MTIDEALSVDRLLEEAHLAAGTEPVRFLAGLGRLTTALATEAGLTGGGIRDAHATLVRALRVQAAIRRFGERHPAAADRPIDRVIVVTGLHRTGTTLLQNLLAEHPELRAPRLWEMMEPTDSDTGAARERVRSYVDEYHRSAPGFRAIHMLEADRPDECHYLIGNSFHSEIFGMRYHIPGYLDWLAGQDWREPYELHRALLRAILWRRPGGRAVILKCPLHLWHGDALRSAYPDAVMVRLHRDPAATVPSGCSLIAAIRRRRSGWVDTGEVGRFWMEHTGRAIDLLARGDPAAMGGLPFIDVRYPDLISDPIAVAAKVCEAVGVTVSGEAERRMRTWTATSRVNGPGAHQYRAADFGLDAGRLNRRFAAYRRQYDL